MFKALDSLMTGLQFGGQQRKVQKYLDEATTNSVLLDLSCELRHAGQHGRFQTLFQTWSDEQPSTPPRSLNDANFQAYANSGHCWTEKTFQAYIESGHLGIDESEIELLWRCFVFHAYHPFPQSVDCNTIRLGADDFMRAATLLAANGANLLGKVENCDYYLHYDENYYRKADFRRIFRSISRPISSRTTKKDLDSDVVADTISVLTMVVPYFIHSGPSLEQLDSAARRLLNGCGGPRGVPREDFSLLLKLLLRTRLDTTQTADEVLANAPVAGVLDSTAEEVTVEELSKVMESLPDIRVWFYQIWSRLFQLDPARSQAQAALRPQPPPSAYEKHVDTGSVGGAELAKRITGHGSST